VITAGVTTLTGTLASSFTYDGARDAFAMHVLAFVMNVAS
jgi:hypothetical protein